MKYAKFIDNVEDFNIEHMFAAKYSKNRFITVLMMWLDKFSCKRSNLIITIGQDLVETVEKRFYGKICSKTVMINNWIDEEKIYLLSEKII